MAEARAQGTSERLTLGSRRLVSRIICEFGVKVRQPLLDPFNAFVCGLSVHLAATILIPEDFRTGYEF